MNDDDPEIKKNPKLRTDVAAEIEVPFDNATAKVSANRSSTRGARRLRKPTRDKRRTRKLTRK